MSRFGLSAALSTPFQANGEIDLPRFVEHACWCLANGCDSVTLFGTTGEGATIGRTARNAAFEAMIKGGIKPRTQMLTSIVASSIEDAVEQAEVAFELDMRALLLTPPYYFRAVDDDGIFNWFAALFERLGPKARDMFAYHLPSVVGISLSVALIGRLKTAFPGIVVGVKDSGSNWTFTEQLLAAHKDLMILVGDERDLGRAVRAGGSGAISGIANIAPSLLRPVAVEGRDEPRITALVDEVVQRPVLAAIKSIIAGQKGDNAWRSVRPPLAPLDDLTATRLLSAVLLHLPRRA